MKFNNGINTTTLWLLRCGPLGCALFIVLFLLQGQLREAYAPLKFPVSSLSIGEHGWIQVINFLVSGALIALFAIGFRKATPLLNNSKTVARLFGAAGLGLAGAGLFSSDPIYGYPVTEPLQLAQFTVTGHLHDLFSIIFFACLPIVCFKMRKHFKEFNKKTWANYTLALVVGMLLFFVLAAIGFKQAAGFKDYAGLFQRLSIVCGFVWLCTLSVWIMRSSERV